MINFYIDYDHIYHPDLVAEMVSKNREISDEILLKIFHRINPPLLEKRPASSLIAMLEGRQGRRPSRGVPSIKWLARLITRQVRPDVHPVFLIVLSARILSNKGFKEIERASRFYRENRMTQRDDVIRGLYWQFRSLIEDNADSIMHPVLGALQIPPGLRPRMQAAEMVWNFLHGYWDDVAPSTNAILTVSAMRH